jgi:hypothetical protein
MEICQLKVQGAESVAAAAATTTTNDDVVLPADMATSGDATLKIKVFSAQRCHPLR